jgi:hypothetical protein
MRVILEVTSGPDRGQKSVLGAFQNVQVGRTERADFAVPHDGRMSSVHFALETDANACYLADLGSRNGTLLNGQPLADRVALRQDDKITAGDTSFRVQIESESAADVPRDAAKPLAATAAFAAAPAAVGVAAPVAEPRPAKRGKVTYAFETCHSGLVLCSGSTADIRPTDLANLLSLKVPLHLIVDPRKIEPKPAEPPGTVDYLFNWIPPEVAALASPIVLSADQFGDWPSLVEQGWGNDAVVCLFSHYDKPSLLEHLRQCLRAKPKQTDMSAGIVGYCWPGVLSMILAHGMHNFVGSFFTGIDAVLIELPDLPEVWQLYGPSAITKLIDDLGFARKEPGSG